MRTVLTRSTLCLLSIALVAGFFFPVSVRAQTPTTTIKNGSGDVRLQLNYDGGLVVPGEFVSGFNTPGTPADSIPAEGAGTRMMWYPAKAAFRAGEVADNSGLLGGVDGSRFWNANSIGDYSVAYGLNTKASGPGSVAMGLQTTASGGSAFAMGTRSMASSSNSVAMGFQTTASAVAAVAMGEETTASAKSATALGNETTASEINAVAMGEGTTASGIAATAMGITTTASGDFAVAMGEETTAKGLRSFAGGEHGKAAHKNTFVWADGSNRASDPFSSGDELNESGVTGKNTFHVQATEGIRFVTDGGTTYIPGGSTGWSTISSREAKTEVRPVDPATVLKAVRKMEVSTWEYEGEEGKGQGLRHIGPMAESFHGALPYDLGGSKEHISSINADGVALGAIKGLARKVEAQKKRLRKQEKRIEELERRLSRLEAQLSDRPSMRASWISPWSLGGFLLVLGAGTFIGTLLRRRG